MRPPPTARTPHDGRREESGPYRRSLVPTQSDFVDYAEAKTEDTTTSNRPMDAYEEWLTERFSDSQDRDEVTTAAEVAPPVRRQSGLRNREPSRPDAYRDAMPTALEVQMDESPPTMDRSEPWEVPVSHDQAFESQEFDTDREPVREEYSEPRNEYPQEREPKEYKSGETRMGAPRVGYQQPSEVAEVYSRKIPPAPGVPRIATPFGGFNQPQYAQPAPVPAYERPSYDRQSYDPLPLKQRVMHEPSMQPQQMPQMQAQMQMHQMQQMQRPMQAQSVVATTPPSRPFQPLLTQVVTSNAPQKEVHRAPWFCLGLAVGVVSMVVAFFLPTSHAEVAASPLPTMQITPPAQQPMQPPAAVQPPMQQQAQQQMQPMAPPAQATMPPQAGMPMPLPPATAVVPPPAQASIASSQKLPTVDVRSLPVAGAKAQAPAPTPRRPQYAARPQAPRRPAAPPPKPLPQDDDDAPEAKAAPQPAPKPAPAQQAQDANALAADTLLQAL
jgi:hypothetical protein